MPQSNVYSNNGPTTNASNAAQLQYGGDPVQAMKNAIQAMGGNPYTSNPLMKLLLATAPGLQSAYYLTNIGAKPDDINAMGGTGQMFGDFLKGQLSNGTINSTLAGVSKDLPQYMNQLRDYQSQINGGGSGQPVSPFAADLERQLQTPQGLGSLMGSLYAPSMGALGQGWMNGLDQSLNSQNNRMLTDYGRGMDPNQIPNFFDYVFGRG